jgi:hypothetical protein
MVMLVIMADSVVTAVVAVVQVFDLHSTVKFLNFRLSHIQATSIQMPAALFVVLTFIFINLRMAAEFSLMTLARRGRSILALTIQSFDITLRPPKVALGF